MPKKSQVSSVSKSGAKAAVTKTSAKKIGAMHVKDRKTAVSASARAELIMPIQRVLNLMRRDRLNVRVSKSAGIMMAALLEYLAAELSEMAGNFALEKKKKRLTNRFIQLAIQSDYEFSKLLSKAVIHKGGVLPHIEPALFPKKKGSAAT